MKTLFILLLAAEFIFSSLGYRHTVSGNLHKPEINCDSIPELNKQILDFVKSTIGKKIGRGECWDLAAQALNLTGAKWDKQYVFGEKVDYKTGCVFPGDIIQFEKVQVEYTKDNRQYKEMIPHHTAIIYEVNGKGDFTLAQQNAATTGRKVGLGQLEVKNITRGKFTIYRPVR